MGIVRHADAGYEIAIAAVRGTASRCRCYLADERARMLRSLQTQGTLAVLCLSAALLLASCTFGPLRISIPGPATPPPPIALRRCERARDVLCILSFGLEPPDRMVIVLLAAPGMPTDLEARAVWNGMTGILPL